MTGASSDNSGSNNSNSSSSTVEQTKGVNINSTTDTLVTTADSGSQDGHLPNIALNKTPVDWSIPRLQPRNATNAPSDGSNPFVTAAPCITGDTSNNAMINSSSSSAPAAGILLLNPTVEADRAAAPSTPAPPRLILANPPPEDPPHRNLSLSNSSSSSAFHLPAGGSYGSVAAGSYFGLNSNTHSFTNPYHTAHNIPDLHLQTNLAMASSTNNAKSIPVPTSTRPSAAALSRSNSFQSSLSPNSAAGSPLLGGFLSEITPLPSPVITADSPGPWRLFRNGSISSRPTSRGSIASLSINEQGDQLNNELSPPGVGRSPSKRKLYQGLSHIDAPHEYKSAAAAARSVSEQANNHKLDVPAVSRQSQTDDTGSEKTEIKETASQPIKREEHLAGRHGQRKTGSAADLQVPSVAVSENRIPEEAGDKEIYTATTVPGNNIRRWKEVRFLGQGTFSKVTLATLEVNKAADSEADLDRNKLVAVKIVENSAAGGASKARIESSLKRELDILKSLKHPSLVHLKAQSIERKRALLILNYCAGGDLFDLATGAVKLFTPKFVRRIFAELVGAVRYLHLSAIVHRDIKLENVLINFTVQELTESMDEILASNRSITTLTDLGLSRRIDFEEPLLTTRCGSEDYAAPELLLGQPYDGRQTDAWALGVLLYAICESRLPFDPLPGTTEHKMRSRTIHRIARCDWKWWKLADTPPSVQEDGAGEVKPPYDPEWNPAKEVVDGLLRRVKKRIPLEEIEKTDWVQGAITVPLEDPPSTEEMEEEDEDIS